MIGEDGQDGGIIDILRNSWEFIGRAGDRRGWSGRPSAENSNSVIYMIKLS